MQAISARKLVVIVCLLALNPAMVQAQHILFDMPTDTIAISGQTTLSNSVTYEAQVLFTGAYQGRGFVFNEWANASEDKWFSVGPNGLDGFSFPTGGPGVLSGSVLLALNQWHHVAYVHNGSQDMLFADGSLIASRTSTGPISNAGGGAFLGSLFRDNQIVDGIVGYLDSFRMSSIARYSSPSFTPPAGDMTTDLDTIMLFNFNEAPGSTVLNDLSGNGHNGALGVGFVGATSPEFVTAIPEPSTWMLISFVVCCSILIRFRYSRGAVATI